MSSSDDKSKPNDDPNDDTKLGPALAFAGGACRPLFPAGTGGGGGALFPAGSAYSFPTFPAFGAASAEQAGMAALPGVGAVPAKMTAFASFQALPEPDGTVGGQRSILSSLDVMDAELCAGTFGHARISDDEDDDRSHGADRDGRGEVERTNERETGREGVRAVFRVQLSSSDSDDEGGKKRKKKDKKREKKQKDRHKHRHREKSEGGGRGSQRETEPERKDREEREERQRLQKKQKKDKNKIDEVNPHHKISLHDIWKNQKPGAVSSSAPISAASVMFFDRFGDSGNFEYGHPFKLEIPTYRTEWFWSGRYPTTSTRRSHTSATATATKNRLWNSTVFPAVPAVANRGSGGGGVGGGEMEGEQKMCWRKRGLVRSMLGIPRGADKNGAKGSWRYLRKNHISKLLDKREKAISLVRWLCDTCVFARARARTKGLSQGHRNQR